MAITDYLTPILLEEYIAFLAAIFLLHKKKYNYWRLFILYLLLISIQEIMGTYLFVRHVRNYPYYNFMMIIQVIFFSYLFFRFHKTSNFKIGALLALTIFMLVYISEGLITAHIKNNMAFQDNYNYYSRMLLSILVTLGSCIYFFDIIKDDTIHNPLRTPEFWIVLGLFFFYFGSLPVWAFSTIVSKIKLSGNVSFFTLIMNSLSFILYGSWIIAFICRKKQMS